MTTSLLLLFYSWWVAVSIGVTGSRAQTVDSGTACVQYGEPLLLSFSETQADDDWLALVPATAIAALMEDSSMVLDDAEVVEWVWKCGGSPCVPTAGRVALPTSATTPGHLYGAVLAQNNHDGAPFYNILAVSPLFTVMVDCVDTVQLPTVQTVGHFGPGEPIAVFFDRHDHTLPDDFIALYPVDTNDEQKLEADKDGYFWKYLCNRRAPCSFGLQGGMVVFDGTNDAWSLSSAWPLPSSWYVAALLRNMVVDGAWVVVQQSEPFFVEEATSAAAVLTTDRMIVSPVPAPAVTVASVESVEIPVDVIEDDVTTSIAIQDDSSTSSPLDAVALAHIRQVRHEIVTLIQQDIGLAAKFLRLIFHDCIGGCDGTYDPHHEWVLFQ